MHGRLALALALALALLAGCVTPASKLAPANAAPPLLDAMGMPIGDLTPLDLNATSCTFGGGHSIHTHELATIIPPPWKPADVIEDIGVRASYSDPGEQVYGPATSGWGNWHTDLICKSWSLNGASLPASTVFGLILTRIEPPPFDSAPVHRNYMVNVIAASDPTLQETLHHAGWHAMPASGGIDWPATDVFHHILDAGEHGVYESTFHTVAAGAPLKEETIRLWWQRENLNGTFSPIAIDMHVLTPGTHLESDVEGLFSHSRTDDHAPLPGAYGQIPGLVYTGLSAEFTWGPQLNDVALDKAYEHV